MHELQHYWCEYSGRAKQPGRLGREAGARALHSKELHDTARRMLTLTYGTARSS